METLLHAVLRMTLLGSGLTALLLCLKPLLLGRLPWILALLAMLLPLYRLFPGPTVIALSLWTQEGDEASFLCTMTYLNYERDPEAVAWLQEVKADEGLALYEEVSATGPAAWHSPITLDEFLAS